MFAMPGGPEKQSCTKGMYANQSYMCAGGTQECHSDNIEQCSNNCKESNKCPFKWVDNPKPSMQANLKFEGELCIKFDENVCDMYRNVCTSKLMLGDSQLCQVLGQVCSK